MNKISLTPIYLSIWLVAFPLHLLQAQNDNTSDMTPVGAEAFEVMRQFFEYDLSIPLEARVVNKLEKPGYVREKIVFLNTSGGQVPGYLAIPKIKTGPYPCVLLVHGLTSSKESWWEENSSMGKLTEDLLASGYAVLSLDAEYHGERIINNNFESPVSILEKGWFVRSRDMMIQSVIEYRRAMDYLGTRAEIDTSRIGVIGYSMGGIMTFILSTTDSRVTMAVSCVSPIITVPYLPTAVHNMAPYIKNKPFLMLMGNQDERNYTRETAQQLHTLISSDIKDLVFFESGHMLPSEWTSHATKWVDKYLK